MIILENNMPKIIWDDLEAYEKIGLAKNNRETKIEFLNIQLEEVYRLKECISEKDFKSFTECILKELESLKWQEI